MYSLIFLGAITFLLSLILTLVVRNAYRRQKPQGVPVIGGIPIVLANLLAYILVLGTGLKFSLALRGSRDFFWHLVGAVLLVFVIGLIDDLKGIEPWHKVVGLTLAACIAYRPGVHTWAIGQSSAGGWNLLLSVLWILLCAFAINVISHMEGLAAGIGLIAAFTFFVIALLQNNLVLAVATISLGGSILGFFPYNFSAPTILLGESGSLLIGFLLGCYSILWDRGTSAVLGMTVPQLILLIPLFYAVLIVLRRFLRRQPLGAPNASQIRHRLQNRGLVPNKANWMFYVFSAIGAIVSVLVLYSRSPWLVIIVFYWATWIWIRHLGYVEFHVAGRMFTEGVFLRQLNAEITLHSYENRLKAAVSPEEYWAIVEQGLHEFGFHEAQFSIAGSTFEWRQNAPSSGSWEVSIPIAEIDSIRLRRTFGTGAHANGFAPFVDLLRRSLTAKRGIFLSHRRAPEAQSVNVGG